MVRSISKNRIVKNVFSKLSPLYDSLEPLLTFWQGTRWRRQMVEMVSLPNPHRVLDACAGTGHLTIELANKYGTHCHIVAVDFCPTMVMLAKQKIRSMHLQRRIEFKTENVEIMPFPEDFFDAAFIALGLRFVSDIRTVLKECYRVLKINAPLVILDLALPTNPLLRWLVHLLREYGFPLWAWLKFRAPSSLLYYLHDTLLHYPDADKLNRMLMRTGFDKVEYQKLCGGVATRHWAVKPEREH